MTSKLNKYSLLLVWNQQGSFYNLCEIDKCINDLNLCNVKGINMVLQLLYV